MASFIIFTIRITLKWVHFYCGTGTDNLTIWEQPFQLDSKKMEQQFEMVSKIRETVEELAAGSGK